MWKRLPIEVWLESWHEFEIIMASGNLQGDQDKEKLPPSDYVYNYQPIDVMANYVERAPALQFGMFYWYGQLVGHQPLVV